MIGARASMRVEDSNDDDDPDDDDGDCSTTDFSDSQRDNASDQADENTDYAQANHDSSCRPDPKNKASNNRNKDTIFLGKTWCSHLGLIFFESPLRSLANAFGEYSSQIQQWIAQVLLGAFEYRTNKALMHRRCWSAYRAEGFMQPQ